MEKETLEEAAERFLKDGARKFKTAKQVLIGFAKWQSERMYSEEEVIAIVEKSKETGLTAEYLLLTEQFKKK